MTDAGEGVAIKLPILSAIIVLLLASYPAFAQYSAPVGRATVELPAGQVMEFVSFDGAPPPAFPFDIETFEPVDPSWPAIREWIPADDTDPQVVFPEDSASTHWVPKEIRLDDERTLVLDLS